MEYTREIKIVIEKDTNKANTKVGLSLGEYDENETLEEFIERVKEYMEDMLITRA
jgi:phage gp16-like protein